MLKFAVIGYGNRISGIVDRLVNSGEAVLTAVMDPDLDTAKKRAADKGYNDVAYYTDAKEMLDKETLDGVLIGTRCTMHTDYALLVAEYDLPLFLEKPVSTDAEQTERLAAILPTMNEKTLVSFPLRTSALVLKVKEIIDSGKLGKISQVQAYNNVPYGRGYYHKWYRDEKETGGQWLQKATHDLDYINFLLDGLKPARICATKSHQIFGGNEPAGKKCADCDKQKTCLESPYNVKKNGDRYIIGEYCCYSKDTTIEDSGSCILVYENGMHTVYTQNFVARNGAGKRGARLIGFKGTLEFDWVTSTIHVYRHQENINEEYKINGATGSHFGGDQNLVENFIAMMKGEETSSAPLAEGISSARLCLAAKKSSLENIFVEL